MTQPVYEIAKWKTVFETAESRKLKNLNWVSVPVNFSSAGYQQMLDEFGDDAPAIYGAWIALVSFAASCPVRGILASSRGKALPISHVSRVTGFPASVFDRLFAWASGADVAWLVPVADPVRVAQDSEKHGELSVSGESPDDIPERRENPPATRPDLTRQDQTRPAAAAASAAADAPEAAAAAAAAGDVLGLGLGSAGPGPQRATVAQPASVADPAPPADPQPAVTAGVDPFFAGLDLAAVRSVAVRLRTAAPTLPRDVVWRSAAIGQVIDPELIPGVIARLAKREIGKPESYLEKTLREECERLGHDYRQLKKRSPPTPPPEPPRGDPARPEQARPDSVRTDPAKADPIPKPAFRRPPRPERGVRVLDPSSNHQPRRTATP